MKANVIRLKHMINLKKSNSGVKKSYVPYLFILPWIAGFLFFTIGPLIFSLIMSFFDWPIVGDVKFIGFSNYIRAFTSDKMFYHSMGVTFKFALIFVPLYILIALSLALLLNNEVKGKSAFKTIFYLPSVISGVAVSMIWIWIFDVNYGVINYLLSLVNITGPNWLGDPKWAIFAMVIASLWGQGTMVLIFLAALKDIPKEYYEAASIDGAGAIGRFFKITLPLITPAILFNLIMTIISAFQQLTLALVMTKGGPSNSTYFYAMHVYNNAFKHFEMGYASANAWIMFVLILTLTLLVFKSSSAWVYYESDGKK
ncbi:carbohydrate ABC transporter permease [Alkaliphilus peptidifermentans]|uniref:Multiple sugar transport system permease protein n=1 Tax=Alkaliphilus peptidifermentans DSM 18978 TaxID=1120976 RepID=A0A1G5L5S3_9FIRM|nr:sugar ABC transporter permease [Alkaliphilus peptidifermentans]SCZ08215.1 multiple sugar transport system permease protein [Alkaliphilus peptidifermentans DSM 18978]